MAGLISLHRLVLTPEHGGCIIECTAHTTTTLVPSFHYFFRDIAFSAAMKYNTTRHTREMSCDETAEDDILFFNVDQRGTVDEAISCAEHDAHVDPLSSGAEPTGACECVAVAARQEGEEGGPPSHPIASPSVDKNADEVASRDPVVAPEKMRRFIKLVDVASKPDVHPPCLVTSSNNNFESNREAIHNNAGKRVLSLHKYGQIDRSTTSAEGAPREATPATTDAADAGTLYRCLLRRIRLVWHRVDVEGVFSWVLPEDEELQPCSGQRTTNDTTYFMPLPTDDTLPPSASLQLVAARSVVLQMHETLSRWREAYWTERCRCEDSSEDWLMKGSVALQRLFEFELHYHCEPVETVVDHGAVLQEAVAACFQLRTAVRQCLQALDACWAHEEASEFRYPVDILLYRDYMRRVKEPLCLADAYDAVRHPEHGGDVGAATIALVEKMKQNCVCHNGKDHELTAVCTRLLNGLRRAMKSDVVEALRADGTQIPTEDLRRQLQGQFVVWEHVSNQELRHAWSTMRSPALLARSAANGRQRTIRLVALRQNGAPQNKQQKKKTASQNNKQQTAPSSNHSTAVVDVDVEEPDQWTSWIECTKCRTWRVVNTETEHVAKRSKQWVCAAVNLKCDFSADKPQWKECVKCRHWYEFPAGTRFRRNWRCEECDAASDVVEIPAPVKVSSKGGNAAALPLDPACVAAALVGSSKPQAAVSTATLVDEEDTNSVPLAESYANRRTNGKQRRATKNGEAHVSHHQVNSKKRRDVAKRPPPSKRGRETDHVSVSKPKKSKSERPKKPKREDVSLSSSDTLSDSSFSSVASDDAESTDDDKVETRKTKAPPQASLKKGKTATAPVSSFNGANEALHSGGLWAQLYAITDAMKNMEYLSAETLARKYAELSALEEKALKLRGDQP